MSLIKKMFQIGKWGRILNGENPNWYLKIEDDTKGSTGGFYIYTVKNPNDENSEDYDDWAENEESLKNYMNYIKLQIEWADSTNKD